MPIATTTGIQSTKKTTRHSTKPVVPKPPRDSDGFKNRAGCVVLSENKKNILLISSNGHSGKWILPAGTLELRESPEDGAVRETLEEAGVIGEVLEKIGVFVDGKKNRTHYYALLTKQIVDDYEECKFRNRSWFPLREAEKELLWRPVQHQVLLTWMARHNTSAVHTSATAEAGEQKDNASDVKQRHEKERVIDEEEMYQVPVKVKSSAG
jgi:8-oxo-dGTP pyrophosphatase MutT (NUDIX family)